MSLEEFFVYLFCASYAVLVVIAGFWVWLGWNWSKDDRNNGN
jgi:hypothetical protein